MGTAMHQQEPGGRRGRHPREQHTVVLGRQRRCQRRTGPRPGRGRQPAQQIARPTAGWTSVTAGSSHTCALRIHALWCWGDDTGLGHTSQQSLPRRVAFPARTGWSLVAAGGVRTCAVRTGHALWCWGWNRYGQLGLGGTTSQFLPRQVTA